MPAVCNVFNIQKKQFKEEDILRRFWSRDSSLWTKDDSCQLDIDSNLAWLDFPSTLEPLFTEISRITERAVSDGLLDWVFLALGSFSLAARDDYCPGRRQRWPRLLLAILFSQFSNSRTLFQSRVIRVNLTSDVPESLANLEFFLEQALPGPH